MLTVSRSVDRVFQIMELFAKERRPLSATEIHQALKMPHSSAVSVLSRLTGLGYFDQNTETKRFFPSVRLHHLCDTVPEAIVGGNPYAELVDRIQHSTDETTTISRLDGLFTMPIYVRSAKHANAWRVTAGLSGALATSSVVGRALLSTLADVDVQRFIQRASHWAARTRTGPVADAEQIMRAVDFVREHGYLCRYNLLLPGIGAISCPLPDAGGERLAITVAGTVERMQARGRQVINALLQEVQSMHRLRNGRTTRAVSPTSPATIAGTPMTSAGALAAVRAVSL
jgi:DNA-binding IclR family transcriptional regulator